MFKVAEMSIFSFLCTLIRQSGLAELPSPPSCWRWCWVAKTQPERVPEQLMASETYLGVEHISAASPDQMAKIVVVPENKMLPACRQSSLISDGVNDGGGPCCPLAAP